MTISNATIARYDRLVARAIKAGRKAAAKAAREAARGQKSIVVDHWTKRKYVVCGYPYGMASIRLDSGRTGFAQYLKTKKALGYQNSVTYYVLDFECETFNPPSLTQSLAVNEARAQAWVDVLNKAGIKSYVWTWID